MQTERRFKFLMVTFGFLLCLVGYAANADIALDIKLKDPFHFLRDSQLPEMAKIKKYDQNNKLD